MEEKALERIAAVCHEANRVYCQTLGDDSSPEWVDAPAWQRKSALDGVRFHLENPYVGPEASHQRWCAHKRSDGWVYGSTKDATAKTHPCLVPFDQLPPEQQRKDVLFQAIVHALSKEL